LGKKRSKLDSAIKDLENQGPDSVNHIPFIFFEDLHKEH